MAGNTATPLHRTRWRGGDEPDPKARSHQLPSGDKRFGHSLPSPSPGAAISLALEPEGVLRDDAHDAPVIRQKRSANSCEGHPALRLAPAEAPPPKQVARKKPRLVAPPLVYPSVEKRSLPVRPVSEPPVRRLHAREHLPVRTLSLKKVATCWPALRPCERPLETWNNSADRSSSKVIEVVSSRGVIFALTHNGLCSAFRQDSKRSLGCLNTQPDEVIRSLFVNKTNGSLITVSVYQSDSYSTLKCRGTPLDDVLHSRPIQSTSLFSSEKLCWPGFVEFDDVNSRVLTFCANTKIYKVWDLATYDFIFEIRNPAISEIKISPGILLIRFHRKVSHVDLQIRSIVDGTILRNFKILLHRHVGIDFIEQFNEKLLYKQEAEALHIHDVQTDAVIQVPPAAFSTPSAFIFLYTKKLFLTFKDQRLQVWNFNGKISFMLEDHTLAHDDMNLNNVFITKDQDYMISFCQDSVRRGSIHVSELETGRRVSKISIPPSLESTQVSALFYDEQQHELYVGDEVGRVHVWTTGPTPSALAVCPTPPLPP